MCYTCKRVHVHEMHARRVGVCARRAGQCRGGGYPVTASGKQYYGAGMSHMQHYSAANTHTHKKRVFVAVAVQRGVHAKVCSFKRAAGVCARLCADIPGIASCPQGSDSNACDEGHCAPCMSGYSREECV